MCSLTFDLNIKKSGVKIKTVEMGASRGLSVKIASLKTDGQPIPEDLENKIAFAVFGIAPGFFKKDPLARRQFLV